MEREKSTGLMLLIYPICSGLIVGIENKITEQGEDAVIQVFSGVWGMWYGVDRMKFIFMEVLNLDMITLPQIDIAVSLKTAYLGVA